MRRFARFRASSAALTLFIAITPWLSRAENAAPLASETTAVPSNIVIGFVGGFVGHDNLHHGPVQLAEQIRRTVPKDTYIRVFENRRRKQAYEAIVRLLDTNHDGVLSGQEKARARIILFGHSWGASAAVLLARDLRREGVPVLPVSYTHLDVYKRQAHTDPTGAFRFAASYPPLRIASRSERSPA